jgi:glycerophosphoryl diester phosphodiesterase
MVDSSTTSTERRLERGKRREDLANALFFVALSILIVLLASGCTTFSSSSPSSVTQTQTLAEAEGPVRFPTPFQIIAHRGASAYAPENTLAAFRIARDLGAFEVELDVQLSSDDVVMLYHDSKLERKTGQAGTVRDYTSAQLQAMDIGSWFDRDHPGVDEKFAGTPINTLDQLFEAFGSELYYHVELKSVDPELARLTLAAIDRAGLRERVRFTSFNFEQVERSHALAPDLPNTLLIRDAYTLLREATEDEETPPLPVLRLQERKIDLARRTGFDQVGLASEDLSLEIIDYAATRGLPVRAWRIKSDADMMRAIEMGACGMTTNWPERLIRELVEHMGSGRP